MDTVLTAEEVRILGSLLEKKLSTPEYYPLSLNALVNACNQKTSRVPVVSYDEQTVLKALAGLKSKRLAWESSLGRVPKYEEAFTRNSKLIESEAAALCILMLRGPQTPGEIRAHSERLHDLTDPGKLEETLDALVEAEYILKIPRMPGQKESRYAHLLSGRPEIENTPQPAGETSPASGKDAEIAGLREELKALREDFESFRAKVEAFMGQFK